MVCCSGHLLFYKGYSLRHFHQSRVDQRLQSIEKAMKTNHQLEDTDLQKLVGSGSISIPACVAAAGTTLIMGFMKTNHQLEDTDLQKLVGSGSISIPACVAAAGTTLIMGYGLGWRGGKWHANRKFRKEQMKLLGQLKPKKWQLKFLGRPFIRPRLPALLRRKLPENAVRTSKELQKDVPVALNSGETQPAC
ncbi:unnamed protein product [Ilex paraguariensis]|uniref:Uncharacterized protein n=1 Tax=Ilex paraguariensis TaxID=185542 RepID=A0ABC8USP4_9AQUA